MRPKSEKRDLFNVDSYLDTPHLTGCLVTVWITPTSILKL